MNRTELVTEILKLTGHHRSLHPDVNFGIQRLLDKYEKGQKAGQHETIVKLWNTGKPGTDDEGDSVDVLGVIETPKNKIKTVFPIRLCGYEWYWVESGKRISDEFKVVKWMHYPTT